MNIEMMKCIREQLTDCYFSPAYFREAFAVVFSHEEIEELLCDVDDGNSVEGFLFVRDEDERYILDTDTGVFINWYKTLGRSNTCNLAGFSRLCLIGFLTKLKNSWNEHYTGGRG